MGIKDFTNDNFIILKTMYDNQVTVLDKTEIRLSQLEIAQALGFSKNKVCTIFQGLQAKGYIEAVGRSKYQLTDSAVVIIETMDNLNKELEGDK